MQVNDIGIIIDITKYSENDVLVTIFSKQHGLYNGLVKSFTSKKHRSVCIIGNFVEFFWQARLPEYLGMFKMELKKSYSGIIIEDHCKLLAMKALCFNLKNALSERVQEKILFNIIKNLFDHFVTDNDWILDFIKFELTLLAELGFGLDLTQCVATGDTKDLYYISPKSGKAVSKSAGEPYKKYLFKLPRLLLWEETNNITKTDIAAALSVTSYFTAKNFLHPKNIEYNPYHRRLAEVLAN